MISLGVVARSRSRIARQLVLVSCSYVVYMSWGKWFALVLFASTVMNFVLGQWLRRNSSALILWLGIAFNLGLLCSYKYIPEMAVHLPLSSLQRFSHLALPLGISFWTFQAMSYLFDLYRGEELDPSFLEFALYMVFFPVAISGPICRMTEMLPQFRGGKKLEWQEISGGLRRIAMGVLMMQLARLLGQGILSGDGLNSGFDHATQWTGLDAWCLAAGYGLQLFLDFAGYSHIAIGAAQALGFVIPENFARPFQATSPSVFWTRWHMSLSFWIRDYVFLPLATIRREVWWRNLILIVSMIAFGVWHRASVLFVLWGCYHGVLLVVHRQVQQLERRLNWNPPELAWNFLSWLVTMMCVSLGWILFRANTLSEARQMLAAMASPSTYFSHALSASLYLLVGSVAVSYGLVVLISAALGGLGSSAERLESRSPAINMLFRNRWFWIPPLYVIALLLLVIVTHTRGTDAAQLMYRNF